MTLLSAGTSEYYRKMAVERLRGRMEVESMSEENDRAAARRMAERYLREIDQTPPEPEPESAPAPEEEILTAIIPRPEAIIPRPEASPDPEGAVYRSHNKKLRHIFHVQSLASLPKAILYQSIARVLHKKDPGVWSLEDPVHLPMFLPRRVEEAGASPEASFDHRVLDKEALRRAVDAMEAQSWHRIFGSPSYFRSIVNPPKPFVSVIEPV